jgi:hypothetical protein
MYLDSYNVVFLGTSEDCRQRKCTGSCSY